jgi:hypothetical protein
MQPPWPVTQKHVRLTWLVQIPSKEQVDALSAELSYRGKDLPGHVHKVLAALPAGTHPMTQFSTAVLALQVNLELSFCKVIWDAVFVGPCTVMSHHGIFIVGPTVLRDVPEWHCCLGKKRSSSHLSTF